MYTLIRKDGRDSTVGNGIVYGAKPAEWAPDGYVYFVETDYGNHMKLTSEELLSYFRPGKPMDYAKWRADRQALHSEPPLHITDEEVMRGMLDDIIEREN